MPTHPAPRMPNAAVQYQGIPPTPDRVFVRDLKIFDNKLKVEFDRHARRFVIVRVMPWGAPYLIWVIEAEDGGFRQPDQRDLKALHMADLWRHGGVKARIMKGEQKILDNQAKEEKHAEDTLRDATKDDKLQLRKTFRQASNAGKANSEFRRIEHQGPGLTLSQIREAKAQGIDPWQKTA